MPNENEGQANAGGAVDANNPEVQAMIAAAVESATSGLKKKNDEILGEKKSLQSSVKEFQERFAGFDGVDPEHVKALIHRMNNDEETKLIAEGKIDEVISRRTDAQAKDFQSRLDALAAKNTELEEAVSGRDNKIKTLVINGNVQKAAAELGVVPTALDDVVQRAATVFQLDDDSNAVARDKNGVVKMGKNGKDPMSVAEWLDTMRESAPHWYPGSSGGGATGGAGKKGSGSGGFTITREQARDHAVYKAAKAEAAKAGVSLQIVNG